MRQMAQTLNPRDHAIALRFQRGQLPFQTLHPGGLFIAGLLRLLQRFSLSCQLLLEFSGALLGCRLLLGGCIAFALEGGEIAF